MRQPTLRLAPFLLACLVAAGFVLRVGLALGPLENLDGVAIPDDAYLFLDLARSIAEGNGPLYGRDYTNGFQPLFAFLLAPIFWFSDGGDGPVHATLVLLSLFDLATLLLLVRLVGRTCARPAATQLVLAAAWACHHLVLRNTLNGMETAVALCLLVAALSAHRGLLLDPMVSWTGRRAAFVGASIGVAMLARVDAILFVPALWSWITWRALRGQLRLERPVPTLVWYAVGAAVAFLPWMVYSGVYTGDFYPVSGRAVRFQADAHYELLPGLGNPTWIHLRRAGGEIWRGNFVLICASALLVCACAMRSSTRRAVVARAGLLLPLAVHAVVLYFAYAIWIQGTWFFHRYLHPVLLLFLVATCVGFDALVAGLSARGRTALTAIACAAIVTASVSNREFTNLVATGRDGNFGYRAIGIWVRDRFPPDTLIGAKQSGAIGYYARDCDVVNLDGVVNREAFRALTERRMLDWLVEQEIETFVLWDYGAAFLRHFSREPRTREFVPIETVPEIHSWGNPGTNAFRVFRLE